MKTTPHRLIIALLVSSVLFVLALQGFWIRNFYVQKEEAFNGTIYAALEKVSAKLEERQHVQMVKERIILSRPAPLTPKRKRPKGSAITTHAAVFNKKVGRAAVRIMHTSELKNSMEQVQVSDSLITVSQGNTMISVTNGPPPESDNVVDKLMDKMMTEIRIIDTDERNGDTIRRVIQQVLGNKGIFIPFEFALKKIFKTKEETLASSAGFQPQLASFVTDLSADKVFSTHNFLLVQFPGKNNFVFSSMKNMLVLSLLFSLILLGTFYYTLRLIQGQKKLNDMKSDFVNNMTHELKTPIATISLALDSISNPQVKNNSERFNDYTRILKEENHKLNAHVERVLQLAQLDKGELPMQPEALNLVELLHSCVAHHALHISGQKAHVKLELSGEMLPVYGDALHLQTVFNNLLDNALKYCSNPCVVTISAEAKNDWVVVGFKDNGIGIDEKLQARIFERFYRVQSGNLHDVKGFGLGLSHARSVIEAHGGSIALQSQKGKGSEFIITLKRYDKG